MTEKEIYELISLHEVTSDFNGGYYCRGCRKEWDWTERTDSKHHVSTIIFEAMS